MPSDFVLSEWCRQRDAGVGEERAFGKEGYIAMNDNYKKNLLNHKDNFHIHCHLQHILV